MLSFSFLFLVQEELEYSWPFVPAETVVREVVVLAVSLISALRHRTTPCSASPNVFSQCVSQCLLSIPSNEVEFKILIVSNYLLDCDGGCSQEVSAFHEL